MSIYLRDAGSKREREREREREGERKITHGIRILTLSFYHSGIYFYFRSYLPRMEIIFQSNPHFQ